MLLGALMLGIATFWDGGLPDAPDAESAKDPAAVTAVDASVSDETRPRNDRKERVVDGTLIEGVEEEAALKDGARAAEAAVKKVSQESATFKIATFNVLATQHTAPGGQRASWPASSWRSGQTVGLIKNHGADIVGMQEVKSDQLNAITGGTGFRAYSGGGETDNSIIYNPSMFEFVSGDSFQVWFMSRNRSQTVVRLRHKASRREFYVINMHPSAGHGGVYASSRNAAFNTVVGYVNRLKSEGVPIFLVGDMNDRENFYCRVIPSTGLIAAQGGGGTCGSAPRMRPVDWVTGWGHVSFGGYVDDFSSESRHISDHPFVSATATLNGLKG